MKKSRYTEEQIIGFLKQAESGAAGPGYLPPGWIQHGHILQMAGQVRWHGGQRCQALELTQSENARLKKLLAEAHLDIEALKVGFGVKS